MKINNKTRLRVLHLLSSAEIAGGERYLFDLINHANRQIKHFIILPYNGPFAEILNDAKRPFGIVSLRHKYFFRAVSEILRFIKKAKINIIHTHGYRANFYGRIACLLTNTKHISTIHVSLFDYNNTPKLLKYFYLAIEKLLSIRTSKYICISATMAEDMRRLKIPQRKIATIFNGVDLKRFYPRPDDDQLRKKFGIHSQTFLVGTASRFVPEKGQIHLIKALKVLKDKNMDLKCLFLGKGPILEYVKNKAVEFEVANMCIFAGIRKDIEEIYPVLDLFVLPSIREPFGLVLLEAMATEIPVLAFDSGGPKEIIKSGFNGVLAPPGDSFKLAEEIQLLFENNKRAKNLALEGRKSVEQNYSVKKTVQNIENIYFDL